MPDYQNSRIYKFIDLETNECYIGSTTLALSQRLAQHVSSYKSYLNDKSAYVTSYKIIANNDYDIVLIELFPCNNKEELHARESHYCQSITCEQNKQYREANREQINNYQNTVIYCQCGCSYTRQNKAQHERTKIHKEYVKNMLYYDIRRGLNMIKALDKHFCNQIK
ncbi:hypothetical protein B484DRAFT_341183 [Ochromonadaceae sp. CCMP2298]|nr:hypothetical protein B484DRAFT_341183 [Ochromonadaceae sp. CCMP2298]